MKSRRKHLDAFFAGRKASTINTALMRQYTSRRLDEEAARSTVNRELMALSKALRLAYDDEQLARMPKIPTLAEPEERDGYFHRHEFLAVREHLEPDVQDLVDFLYYTGWRRSEAASLVWFNVDFKVEEITLPAEFSKNEESRTIPMSAPLREIMKRRSKKRHAESPFAFHRQGREIVDFKRQWRTATEKAGLPGRLVHDLQRTFITNADAAGIPLKVIGYWTGHKRIEMILRYRRTRTSQMKRHSDRLADYLDTAHKDDKIASS